MDFDFSDDQEQLRDAVRKWVDKGYDFERRRAIVAAGGFDRAAYTELAELGLTGLLLTRSEEGMTLFDDAGHLDVPAQGFALVPAHQREVAALEPDVARRRRHQVQHAAAHRIGGIKRNGAGQVFAVPEHQCFAGAARIEAGQYSTPSFEMAMARNCPACTG